MDTSIDYSDSGPDKLVEANQESAEESCNSDYESETSTGERDSPDLDNKCDEMMQHKTKGIVDSPGIVHLSRIPPFMKVLKLRHLMSQFGEVTKIFLQPEDFFARKRRLKRGGKKKKRFVEGWIEFKSRYTAELIADSLNNTEVGGKRGNHHYYDLWNIKYLRNLKWYHLTERITYNNAVRDQKLKRGIYKAKKENQIYLQRVEKSKEIFAIEERKERQRGNCASDAPDNGIKMKYNRKHRQRPVIGVDTKVTTSKIPENFLVKLFPNSIN